MLEDAVVEPYPPEVDPLRLVTLPEPLLDAVGRDVVGRADAVAVFAADTLRTGDSVEALALVPEADAVAVPDVRLTPDEVIVPVFLLTLEEVTPMTSPRRLPVVEPLSPQYMSLPPWP